MNIESTLISAISRSDLDLIKSILKSKTLDIGYKDNIFLSEAIFYGDIEIVKLLVKKGANLKRNEKEFMVSAIKSESQKMMDYLIGNGLSFKDADELALETAMIMNNFSIVKKLVNRGIKVTDLNLDIMTEPCYNEIIFYLFKSSYFGNRADTNVVLKKMADCAMRNSNLELIQFIAQKINISHLVTSTLSPLTDPKINQYLIETYKEFTSKDPLKLLQISTTIDSGLYMILINAGIDPRPYAPQLISSSVLFGNNEVLEHLLTLHPLDVEKIHPFAMKSLILSGSKVSPYKSKLPTLQILMKNGFVPALFNDLFVQAMAESQDNEAVQFLIESGINPRTDDDHLLRRACVLGRVSRAKYLVGLGCKLDSLDGYISKNFGAKGDIVDAPMLEYLIQECPRFIEAVIIIDACDFHSLYFLWLVYMIF